MAEARGFEPPRLLPAHTISSRAPSTTRPRFRPLFYHTLLFSIKYAIIDKLAQSGAHLFLIKQKGW